MSRAEQVAARLAELEGASAAEYASGLREYDVRDIAAALAAKPASPGGGSQPLTGSGAPSDEDGADGQLYIDTDTHDVYVKAEGTWF